jgi:hypothetical protein
MIHWKECERKWSWPSYRYYPRICLNELEATTNNVNQESQYPGNNLHRAGPESYHCAQSNCPRVKFDIHVEVAVKSVVSLSFYIFPYSSANILQVFMQ